MYVDLLRKPLKINQKLKSKFLEKNLLIYDKKIENIPITIQEFIELSFICMLSKGKEFSLLTFLALAPVCENMSLEYAVLSTNFSPFLDQLQPPPPFILFWESKEKRKVVIKLVLKFYALLLALLGKQKLTFTAFNFYFS